MRYAALIPMRIKTPKGEVLINAGQPFKVANNEFLLGLIKQGTVRPVRDILKDEYRDLNKRLSELPAVNIEAWPELNADLQTSLRQMNAAMENEDMQRFIQAKERVLYLYMQAVALAEIPVEITVETPILFSSPEVCG
ncbi:hypothetical protein [Candidatus Magnetominusculus xianensis]|uniref:Uncharacterized protein n=1 Tax=Candidatus Magnetominusculus xianensis TaxID=1748249 RepID=A0ABR5SI69_9BACT|nr:hypothetical protein [Candidatus Magnetominusculus xianensis]KWT92039.1 hypothetical protein ASN18_0592 [Candidatus Magnetominusculus xianensis]MBF0404619.1 hypothetical protein [Nitrospirota bacterium]